MAFLKVTPLGQYWIYPIGAAVLTFFTIEVGKQVFGAHLEDKKTLHKIK